MKHVETSNQSMVDNMKQVQDIMVTIVKGVKESEETTRTMMSKYDETAKSVSDIENVVGKLVSELGAGGFMSVEDIQEVRPGEWKRVSHNSYVGKAGECVYSGSRQAGFILR